MYPVTNQERATWLLGHPDDWAVSATATCTPRRVARRIASVTRSRSATGLHRRARHPERFGLAPSPTPLRGGDLGQEPGAASCRVVAPPTSFAIDQLGRERCHRRPERRHRGVGVVCYAPPRAKSRCSASSAAATAPFSPLITAANSRARSAYLRVGSSTANSDGPMSPGRRAHTPVPSSS